MSPFFRAFVRPLSLAVVGCVLVGLCLGWHPGDDSYDRGYADAQVSRFLHAQAVTRRSRDSLAALATSAETVYVATRRKAHALVAELPPVETAGDTIVLTEGRFPTARPVVALVVQQARVIQVQDSALVQADGTIVALHKVIAADSLTLDAKDSVIALQRVALSVARQRPAWPVRVWNAVKVPLAVGGGFVIGATLSHAIGH